ncbi:MAG TPA: hypothetical protein DDZ04_00935, partial [Parabacteroides sp.]|nr:hypothetical protein [Parabacteroides sp.]
MELQDIPHGREMNAASRDQLHEKELINNDFLARHGEVNIQENTDLEEVSEDEEYSEGNGTGAEWTAEGIARIHGYSDAYYKALEIQKAQEPTDLQDAPHEQESEDKEYSEGNG